MSKVSMSIAVDQTRLRRISSALVVGETLDRAQALAIVEIAQLAAGAEPDEDPQEHTILQAAVQHICSLAGLELDEVMAIAQIPDAARHARFDTLGRQLATPGTRELAYAVAFLVSVSDLELSPTESSDLEELQRVLHVDHRRATDLAVFIAEAVAAEDAA
jgi:hypothetical protein